MVRFFLLLFLLVQSLFAQNITVAVAANVSYAIDTLKEEFLKNHPDIKVRVILGGSGKLVAQIRNGAPYGLFMSADMRYPQALFHEGKALTQPKIYAQGALAYFSIKDRDFSQGMALLLEKKISRIAIANPKTAPYGRASIAALKKAKIYNKIATKFVFGESISQTLSYAIVAADIGIVAKSSLYSPTMKHYQEGSNWADVDSSLYRPINQGVVLLQYSKNSAAYRAFYDFILSDQAKKIFKKFGYLVQ